MFQGSELEFDSTDPPGRIRVASILDEIVSKHMTVTESLPKHVAYIKYVRFVFKLQKETWGQKKTQAFCYPPP